MLKFVMLDEYLPDLHHKIDIINITETWLRSSPDLSFFQLDGYDTDHLDRGSENGGGAVICTQNTLRHSIINHLTCSIDDVLEYLSVNVLLHEKYIVISCHYKHPTCTNDELVGNLEKSYRVNQFDIYLCDVFNINISNQIDNASSEFLQCLYSLSMLSLINKPTRITNHYATLYDNIFRNAIGIRDNSGFFVNDIGDHLPILAIRE